MEKSDTDIRGLALNGGTSAKIARVGIFGIGFWLLEQAIKKSIRIRIFRYIQEGNKCKKCTGWSGNFLTLLENIDIGWKREEGYVKMLLWHILENLRQLQGRLVCKFAIKSMARL